MVLRDIVSGDLNALDKLLSFGTLSVLLREMIELLSAHDARLVAFETDFSQRLTSVETAVETLSRLPPRVSQLEADTRDERRNVDNRCTGLDKAVAALKNRVHDLTGDVARAERSAAKAREEAKALADRLKAQITTAGVQMSLGGAGAGGAGGLGAMRQGSAAGSGLGGSGGGGGGGGGAMSAEEKELLSRLRSRVSKNEDSIKALTNSGGTLDAELRSLRLELVTKANLKTVDQQFNALEPKVEKLRRDHDNLDRGHDQTREELATKAETSLVDTKADRTDLLDKATKDSVEAVSRRVGMLTNDVGLTGTMIENLRKIVDGCSEDQRKLHVMIDSYERGIHSKAELDYVNGRFAEIAGTHKVNARGIRELCRTKADHTDITSLESQITALLRGEDAYLAAGRLHFRCLSCDKFGHAVTGPGTRAYTAASAASPTEHGVISQIPDQEEVALYGSDGKAYRGAVPSFELYGVPSARGGSASITSPRNGPHAIAATRPPPGIDNPTQPPPRPRTASGHKPTPGVPLWVP
jgi:phage shock protein A